MLYELHAWEEHPEYPSTEIRRDDNEREIVDLCPEGCDKSQCWTWSIRTARQLPPRHGVTSGSDMNKEVARAQADAAVVAFGYTINNPASWAETARREAPAVALRIRGLPLGEAARITQEAGIVFRIGTENGRVRVLEDDINRHRVTVTVMDGIVTDARPG